MLHLIPDDDELPHAPTSECGCDPQIASIRGQQVLVHFRPRPEVRCSFEFADSTLSASRLRAVMGHE